MAAGRAKLLGGPLDGYDTASRPDHFIYVGLAGSSVRVYDAPAENRFLYRRESLQVFVFAGHTHRRCEGCEAYHPTGSKECSLCGGKLAPP